MVGCSEAPTHPTLCYACLYYQIPQKRSTHFLKYFLLVKLIMFAFDYFKGCEQHKYFSIILRMANCQLIINS